MYLRHASHFLTLFTPGKALNIFSIGSDLFFQAVDNTSAEKMEADILCLARFQFVYWSYHLYAFPTIVIIDNIIEIRYVFLIKDICVVNMDFQGIIFISANVANIVGPVFKLKTDDFLTGLVIFCAPDCSSAYIMFNPGWSNIFMLSSSDLSSTLQ